MTVNTLMWILFTMIILTVLVVIIKWMLERKSSPKTLISLVVGSLIVIALLVAIVPQAIGQSGVVAQPIYQLFSDKGIAGGYASLDGASHVPAGQLDLSAYETVITGNTKASSATYTGSSTINRVGALTSGSIGSGFTTISTAYLGSFGGPQATNTFLNSLGNFIAITGAGADDDSMYAVSATYTGSTSIKNLGTITAGTWNGSVISTAYLGSGTQSTNTWLNSLGQFTTPPGGSDDDSAYELLANKGIANGYAPLNASSVVSASYLGSGGNGTNFLRSDGTFQVPAGGGGGDTTSATYTGSSTIHTVGSPLNVINSQPAQYNTYIGNGSGLLNASGAFNTTLGISALQDNTSGSDNTAMGYAAGKSNSTGSHNTAFGQTSLNHNNFGNGNTAVGDSALNNNMVGSTDAQGEDTQATVATSSYNTAVGMYSGWNSQTGSNNTFLGYNTWLSGGTLSNVTVIGANSQATASNQVVLGDGNVTSTVLHGVVTGPYTMYFQRDLTFFYPATVVIGDWGQWVRMEDAAIAGDITGVYGVYTSAATDVSTIQIQKSTQANIDGTPSWSNILSTPLTIDANERSSNTAAAPAVFSTAAWGAGDNLRLNFISGGTNGSDLTIKLRFRQKVTSQ